MIERRPIPAIAKRLHAMLVQEHEAKLAQLGADTVAAVGLTEQENCTVDFNTGEIRREVPDLAPRAKTAQASARRSLARKR